MSSRGRTISKANASHFRALLESDPPLGVRLAVETPRVAPNPGAAVDPRLDIYPIGETRDRQNNIWLYRPEVVLLFRAPLDARGHDSEYWEAIAEAYVETLINRKAAGWTLDQVETDSLWDPGAQDHGRFTALYRLTYVDTRIPNV